MFARLSARRFAVPGLFPAAMLSLSACASVRGGELTDVRYPRVAR
jgi:hypothetical protein